MAIYRHCGAFWACKLRAAVAGPVSKMAITRSSRIKTRGTLAHEIWNIMLFDLVRGPILPKMHVAPGHCNGLPCWPVFGLKTPPGGGCWGV